jgi:hypothetical protein
VCVGAVAAEARGKFRNIEDWECLPFEAWKPLLNNGGENLTVKVVCV